MSGTSTGGSLPGRRPGTRSSARGGDRPVPAWEARPRLKPGREVGPGGQAAAGPPMRGPDFSALNAGGTSIPVVRCVLESTRELDMTRRSSMRSWARRSVPIAMVLVALAQSLCLFQVASTGTHHAGMSPDVCPGFFFVSFLVILPYFAKAGGLPAEPLSPP